jgi:hypothetical protein
MLDAVRKHQLNSHVEQFVTPGNISGNPILGSLLVADNILPLSSFSTDPWFIRQRVSTLELVASCAALGLKFTSTSHIALPFRIIHNQLRIHSRAPIQELQTFLGFLSGATLEIQDCSDYYLVTSQTQEIFALWRALRIVPFRGELITASLHWAPIIETKPAQTRVSVERTQKRPLIITRKGEEAPSNEKRGTTATRKGRKTGKWNGGRKVPPLNQTNFPSFANLAS